MNLGVYVTGSKVAQERLGNLCIRAKEEQTDGKAMKAALIKGGEGGRQWVGWKLARIQKICILRLGFFRSIPALCLDVGCMYSRGI